MQPHGSYNIVVGQEGNVQKPPRVGLLHQRTAVPLFLLYLRELSDPFEIQIHSQEDVEAQMHATNRNEDKSTWKLLFPFFDTGGTSAHVVALPLPEKDNLLTTMLGEDKGLNHRTGVHSIKGASEYADLVLIPQAGSLLNAREHKRFYETLFDLSDSLEPFFIIVDFPKSFSLEEAYGWLRNVHCANAAAYFPWILRQHDVLPPGPLVAAAFQINDEKYGIHDLPTNRPLGDHSAPVIQHTPSQLQESLEHRLNIIHRFPDQNVKLWGGCTLADRLDFDSRFISTQRTTQALREAIHQLCEPFVLEPASTTTTELIDVSLQTFFQSVKKLFDPGAKEPFYTEIALKSLKGEDVIEVNVRFSLPYALNQIQLSLGLSG